MIEDSDRTKKLMAEASDPPTEDEIASIQAQRIADQVDHDILMKIEEKFFTTKGHPACMAAKMDGRMCILPRGHPSPHEYPPTKNPHHVSCRYWNTGCSGDCDCLPEEK